MFTIRTARQPIRKAITFIIIVLFILSTAQTICLLILTVMTISYDTRFTVPAETLTPATVRQLEHDQNVLNLYQALSDSMIATTNLIADGLLIWRCFVMWGRRYFVIALPVIILMAGTACGYGVSVVDVVWYLRKVHHPMLSHTGRVFTELIHYEIYFTRGFLIMSAVTNMMISTMIVYRILVTFRSGYAAQLRKHMRLISLIIESGVIYSVSLLLSGALYSSGYNTSQSIVMGFQYQLVGIFPTLIVLLVSLGKIVEQTASESIKLPTSELMFAPNPELAVEEVTVKKARATHHLSLPARLENAATWATFRGPESNCISSYPCNSHRPASYV
ncbi:hypothetical protein NEOLEDRAFT_1142980 [Neolentinus lepideus HHB14362 ss-1]|uniref:Uncharacterized protein n=1 Tax=Neolentinus lepideus HHB14362 ss-1 TaxID=1314782 RepID=A0A165MT09_9AGAM|nr:hypothetical protein NEOLEDRAFT_1142980 [Neolentinus lepideus HHB14362 ss-1]